MPRQNETVNMPLQIDSKLSIIVTESRVKSPMEAVRTKYTKLSQEKFAQQIGVDRSTYLRAIKRASSDIKLTFEQIRKMSIVCGLTLEQLFQEFEQN